MQKLETEDDLHLLVNINFNEVLGYTAIHAADNAMKEIPLLKEFRCICPDYEPISDIVTVADMRLAI